jgi:integrase
MAVLKLNQSMLSTLVCEDGKRRMEFCDSEVSGLYLEVRSGNNKTFYWRAKDSAGKTFHTKLGRVTDISLADARKKVMALKAEHANGSTSQSLKSSKNGGMLLDDLWTEYIAFAKSTKRSWVRDEQLWRLRIQPKFGHLKLSEITLKQIQVLMMDIRTEGLSGASADHHGQLLRRMGNLAVKWGYLDVNFARGIQLYHEYNGVENIPDDAQIQKLMHVLHTDDNRPICLLVQFLLSTGCRLNEALSAQWKNMSTDNRLWTVPHESSKSKRPRSIPLNDSALEVLKQIKKQEKDVYVFTNAKTQKAYVNVFKPWDRIRTKAGLAHLRLHDLRHMYATICVNNGCTIFEVSQLLGHADTRVSQRYSHLNTSTMLTAANSVSQKLSTLMRPKLVVEKLQEAA